jgi:CheY-like chemotaxis protein
MVHNISENKYHFVPDWQQHKVLIVEDVESNYQYIYSVLGKTGIQIIWASDGREAIEFYRNNPDIDLVLMDIKLPIMNGLDATQTLKSMKPDLPVIAVTAYAMSEDKDKCFEAGCDDFIVKPINRFELLAKIENYFESQEL